MLSVVRVGSYSSKMKIYLQLSSSRQLNIDTSDRPITLIMWFSILRVDTAQNRKPFDVRF